MHPLLRIPLVPLSWAYAAVVVLRNRRYDRFINSAVRVGVPVISVGNITVGGTGKTPMVVEVVRTLRGASHAPAIVTRGYGAIGGATPDEVAEFNIAAPDVPVVINADRVAGVREARVVFGCNCAVLDDGFQHRRIDRDLDIVLVDALDPWGGGFVLPAGRLREPLSGLIRAKLLVITRANQADPAAVNEIQRRLHSLAPGATVFRSAVEPIAVVAADGESEPVESLAFRSVLPVCGVGNPRSFLGMVAEHAGHVGPPSVFRDHHNYDRSDVGRLMDAARREGADVVLTTRKDWVKLHPLWPHEDGAPQLLRLDTRIRFLDGRDAFDETILRTVEPGRESTDTVVFPTPRA